MRDDRAERALALALTEHETDHDFAPLDLADLRAAGGSDDGSTSARRRPFWHHLMAAAVVLVVVAPLGGLALQALNARNEAPSAVPASAPAAGGAARDEAAPQPASDTAGGTAERAGGTVMSDGCRIPVFDTGSSMHFPTRATCADLLVGELSTPVFADPVLAEACGRR